MAAYSCRRDSRVTKDCHEDQAIASRDPTLVHLAVALELDSMRGDPRFARRLQSMPLPSIAMTTLATKELGNTLGNNLA